MGLYRQIDEASFDQLVALWNGDPPQWADSRELFLDEIALVLAQSGADGVSFLKTYGNDPDTEKRKAAVYFLADKRVVDSEILDCLSEILDCLKAAFHAADLGLKTKALWGCMNIEHFPLPRRELEALLLDHDERIAALALVYLSRANPTESFPLLRQALSSPNPRMREYACDEVGDREIAGLKVNVVKLLDDADGAVREAAQINSRLLCDEIAAEQSAAGDDPRASSHP